MNEETHFICCVCNEAKLLDEELSRVEQEEGICKECDAKLEADAILSSPRDLDRTGEKYRG